VRIEVADSGVGIPEAALPRIFDMFTQVGRHPEQESGGLGIGLHLVRQMTELHGGAVRAHSAGPGKGSTFVVELPLASLADVAPSHVAEGATEAAAGLRILVADDNADAAELLRELLARHGHTVDVVGNGHAALEAAARVKPDVALLDIGMPGLNGHDVARRLRAQPDTRATRLVALSGWGTDADRARGRRLRLPPHQARRAASAARHCHGPPLTSGHRGLARLRGQAGHVGERQRLSEQPALAVMDPMRTQELGLRFAFDAFGNHPEIERMRHRHDVPDDLAGGRAGPDRLDE
jgi:CheY-like chemotaxis protein